MKKMVRVLMFSLMIFTLVGCQIKSEDKSIDPKDLLKNDNNLTIKIIQEQDSTQFNEKPITLRPKINGEVNQEIQYRWILEYDKQYKDVVGFISEESGPLDEIVNSGHDVQIGLFSELMLVEDTVIEFKVILELEAKKSATVLVSDEISLEYRDGVFKIE